jgi:two-component system OmpR family response regulator
MTFTSERTMSLEESPSGQASHATVLLIEDDAEIAAEILAGLQREGYRTRHAATGTEGLEAVRGLAPDLAIVDRTLPGIDGLTLIDTLHREGIKPPVLVLSALSSADERIKGLKAGGDDYLGKPFVMGELFARVEALLRRPSMVPETSIAVGPLRLNLITRKGDRDGREIHLLPREFKLLEFMMRRPNQVLSRGMLLEQVWNHNPMRQSNLVNVHMGRLRHKVDAPGEGALIKSVHGVGFALHDKP